MDIALSFMSGAGNLFTVIDNRQYNFTSEQASWLAQLLCNAENNKHMQTEGFMLISDSEEFDFHVQFYNPDGSSGMMCGNGGRCAVRYAQKKKFTSSLHVQFDMADTVYEAKIHADEISLFLPPPLEIKYNVDAEMQGRKISTSFVNVGSEHLVVDVSSLDNTAINNFDVEKNGSYLRNHEQFAPNGLNANFYQLFEDHIKLRTYECGVEAETGACGTGAISTALSAVDKYSLSFPITIIPRSGIPLSIDIIGTWPGAIDHIILTGHAAIIKEDILTISEHI